MLVPSLVIRVLVILSLRAAAAWTAPPPRRRSASTAASFGRRSTRLAAQVGVFYGTSTGSTQAAAELIHRAFGPGVCAAPVDVDALGAGELPAALAAHGALVVGTPTWNTGADTERSGTGWDELYYTQLPALREVLRHKRVAVFGLGDQVSYAENYADASGELFDVFSDLGCVMLGAWSQEGYEHEDSKAIRGDKFCGLMLDMVNQEELSEDRVQRWVAQLIAEGILETDGSEVNAPVIVEPAVVEAVRDIEFVNGHKMAPSDAVADGLLKDLTERSDMLDAAIASHSTGGFTPHTNPVTMKTMWTSPDGRKSFVTSQRTPTSFNP